MRNRRQVIPKDGGTKVRVLSIPAIRDRVVQGALKLILEPVFEADFQPGSYGYRPKRTAHAAVTRVAKAIVQHKTRVIDIDLRAYFDNVRHHLLLEKVARRVNDPDVLSLLKLILKASGKQGVPQGGVISPLLSNVYLTEVDRMLERAKAVTRYRTYTSLEYVRWADDLVILVDANRRHDGLLTAVTTRLREELVTLQVEVNEEKSRTVDLTKNESFGFLGFDFRRVRSLRGVWRPQYTPQMKKRTALLRKLKVVFRRFSVPAGGPSGGHHQPGTPGLGHLFRHGSRESVLRLRPRLGREEGTATHDAVPGNSRASGGRGGVDAGSTGRWDSSVTTESGSRRGCRKRSRLDRSHKP